MRKKHGLTILENPQEVHQYLNGLPKTECEKHEFVIDHNLTESECINPHGEFVVGYGHSLVFVSTKFYEKCRICGKTREKPGDKK